MRLTRGVDAGNRRLLAVAVAALVVLAGCGTAVGGLFDDSVDREIAFEERTDGAGIQYNGTGLGVGGGNAGVYALDYDGDGWQDLLVVGGERPALFENTGGEFERSGALPELERPFKSATVVDVEEDGRTDLVLFGRDGGVVSLRNTGGGFERTDYGFGNLTYPLGATAADYDGDGDPDLFVYQSGDWAEHKPRGYFSMYGQVEDDNGNPNYLYENTGDGFERVDVGLSGDRWSLAASFVDLTGDGLPDIHVANDYNNDTLYVNRGDGTFEQRLLGGATARNGMSSEVADVDDDGRPDIFVSNVALPVSRDTMSEERYQRIERLLEFVIHSGRTKGNTLLVNQGGGEFVDRADEYGVRQGGWGWAASLVDLDNDADRDLIHSTQDVVRIYPENQVYTLPMVYERNSTGFERLDASERGFRPIDGRGMVTLDYDHDGDRDVVVANFDGPFAFFENTGTFPTDSASTDAADAGNSVAFEVVDGNGAPAFGATVTVRAGGDETVVYQTSNADYLSHDPYVEHVGLGDADSATLQVTWPDGTERTFEVAANRRIEVARDGVTVLANTTG